MTYATYMICVALLAILVPTTALLAFNLVATRVKLKDSEWARLLAAYQLDAIGDDIGVSRKLRLMQQGSVRFVRDHDRNANN